MSPNEENNLEICLTRCSKFFITRQEQEMDAKESAKKAQETSRWIIGSCITIFAVCLSALFAYTSQQESQNIKINNLAISDSLQFSQINALKEKMSRISSIDTKLDTLKLLLLHR
jgi:flagellar basal body-associated protein FliL